MTITSRPDDHKDSPHHEQAESEPPPPHRTYAHATKGYDEQFEVVLAEAIIDAIIEKSRVTDLDAVILRTGETASALITVLTTMLAMSPDMHVPSRLRQAVEEIAKRIKRDAARTIAAGTYDRLGAGKWRGNA